MKTLFFIVLALFASFGSANAQEVTLTGLRKGFSTLTVADRTNLERLVIGLSDDVQIVVTGLADQTGWTNFPREAWSAQDSLVAMRRAEAVASFYESLGFAVRIEGISINTETRGAKVSLEPLPEVPAALETVIADEPEPKCTITDADGLSVTYYREEDCQRELAPAPQTFVVPPAEVIIKNIYTPAPEFFVESSYLDFQRWTRAGITAPIGRFTFTGAVMYGTQMGLTSSTYALDIVRDPNNPQGIIYQGNYVPPGDVYRWKLGAYGRLSYRLK